MPQAGIEPTTNTLLSVGRSRTIDQLSQNLDWKTIETDTTPTKMLKIRFLAIFCTNMLYLRLVATAKIHTIIILQN